MARIQFNGDHFLIPDANVDETREALESMQPGDRITIDVQDLDGDKAWLFIPYGVAVTIRYFD